MRGSWARVFSLGILIPFDGTESLGNCRMNVASSLWMRAEPCFCDVCEIINGREAWREGTVWSCFSQRQQVAKGKAGRIPLTLRDSSKRSEEKTKSSHVGCTCGWDPGPCKPRLWISTEQGRGRWIGEKRSGGHRREGRSLWRAKWWVLLVHFLLYLHLFGKKVYHVLSICEELLEKENSRNTKQGWNSQRSASLTVFCPLVWI